jgi:hypothetical protein
MARSYKGKIWGAGGLLVHGLVRRPYGCSFWKGVQVGWDRFSTNLSIQVGNGQ